MELNRKTKVVIGIDLGGTKISGALFTFEGDIITKTDSLLQWKSGTEVGSLILEHIFNLIKTAKASNLKVDAIGICVPGISNKKNNTVWVPNIQGWENYPLYEEIRNTIKDESISITIENDRSCYILGETWKGTAKGCPNAIFIAVGTGIGAGIIVDGKIISGSEGVAGAIGWMALNQPYLSDYDACGNFEYYASGEGIAQAAKKLLEQGDKSKILKSKELSTFDVFYAYKYNDPVAIKVLDQAIEYWGMAVANLVSIFNPEKIIFGGGVFGPAVQFLDRIMQESIKWAQPISIAQVRLESSSLKGEAGLIGAGYLAIKSRDKFKSS